MWLTQGLITKLAAFTPHLKFAEPLACPANNIPTKLIYTQRALDDLLRKHRREIY
jgi:hypothetical protein